MVLFVSQEVSDYIKNKYGFDLSIDENISTKKYNPNSCLARVWKSDPNYIPNAGGFSDIQCTSTNTEGEKYCQCHLKKSLENNLPFGNINEPPPEEPMIKDINGESIRYYWMYQSDGMLKEIIFLKEEEEKQRIYNEKRGRGRPPTKKTLYKNIDWNKLYNDDKLNSLSLVSLKEYLTDNNLNIYGKKQELIDRIKENIRAQLID